LRLLARRRGLPTISLSGDVVSCAYGMIWGDEGARPLGAWRGPWYRMSPLLGALTHLHLGPASAGPFSIFGREGRVFLVVSHWKCTMNSIIRLR
jgi:hypothetical protein